MTYKLLPDGSMRLDDGFCIHVLTAAEFSSYMIPFRDSDPDFYAELVHIYVLMCKPLSTLE